MRATPTAQFFRFLALPGEVRNQIYELLLVGRYVKHLGPHVEHVKEAIKSPIPAILQTNRQIRQEAGSIYYTHALFHLSLYWNNWPAELEVYRDWMKRALCPQSAPYLKKVEVFMGRYWHVQIVLEEGKDFEIDSYWPKYIDNEILDRVKTGIRARCKERNGEKFVDMIDRLFADVEFWEDVREDFVPDDDWECTDYSDGGPYNIGACERGL